MANYALPTNREAEDVTGNKTLDEGDNGVVQNVTASATITLPSTSAGATYTILNGGEGEASEVTVTISPAAADKIMGNGLTSADNKDLINTTGRGGVDFVTLVGDGVDGWKVAAISGTWTREA
jgi:hypothetical protein